MKWSIVWIWSKWQREFDSVKTQGQRSIWQPLMQFVGWSQWGLYNVPIDLQLRPSSVQGNHSYKWATRGDGEESIPESRHKSPCQHSFGCSMKYGKSLALTDTVLPPQRDLFKHKKRILHYYHLMSHVTSQSQSSAPSNPLEGNGGWGKLRLDQSFRRTGGIEKSQFDSRGHSRG